MLRQGEGLGSGRDYFRLWAGLSVPETCSSYSTAPQRQLTFRGPLGPTEESQGGGSAEPTGLSGPPVTLEPSEQRKGFPPYVSLSPVFTFLPLLELGLQVSPPVHHTHAQAPLPGGLQGSQ